MKFIKNRLEFIKEAFESSAISGAIKYIKSKCPPKSDADFVRDLKFIGSRYDYPISKLNDRFIKYLPRKKALQLKGKQAHSSWEVSHLKFWFSLEEGYLGYTGVGKKELPYKRRTRYTSSISENSLDMLSKKYPNGELIPITEKEDYENLKTGDIIVGIFNSSDDEDYICWATAYKEDRKVYAIQNESDGGKPDSSGWEQFGYYSWVIFDGSSIEFDHHALHLFRKSAEKLHIKGTLQIDEENPLNFNLPIDSYGNLSSWIESYRGIRSEEEIDKADFAIVVDFDDMINPDIADYYEYPSETREIRRQEKEGALYLQSDEQIRKENIERYINLLVKKLGISAETDEFENLQKIIRVILCGKFSMTSILRGKINDIKVLKDTLFSMMATNSKKDKEYYFNRVVEFFKNQSSKSISQNKSYNDTIAYLKSTDKFVNQEVKEELLKQLNKVMTLGQLISDKITSTKVNNLTDLAIILSKLTSLQNLITDEPKIKFNPYVVNVIRHLYDIDEVEYQIERISMEDLEINKKSLENIEKVINSIL